VLTVSTACVTVFLKVGRFWHSLISAPNSSGDALGATNEFEDLELILDQAVDFLLFYRFHTEDEFGVESENGHSSRIVFSTMKELLEKVPEEYFSKEYLQKLSEFQQNLEKLIGLDVLWIEAKAGPLLSDRSNRVLYMQLLSEGRPVFNNDGTQIEAKTLTKTLRLQYRIGPDNTQVAYFSMDPEDLDELAELIDRARRKNKAIIEENERNGQITLRYEREKYAIEEEASTND
jgi:phenylalanine-4-hydroxylase